MAIHFAQTEIIFKLKNKQVLKTWIKKVIENEKLNLGEIAYTFCSDDELLKINQQFLEHDTYTDIITFDYREGKVVNGEIHISVDRVKENAEKFKTTFELELHRVMIHGVLHICGYKDKSKLHKEEMRKKEDSSLKLLSTI
ncbi:MAG: rRNA maturation RNase YbeY [Bacteroidetes bacterium]|nr:rRNA maturation RNase YbeY [Bacteroidota bacterium]